MSNEHASDLVALARTIATMQRAVDQLTAENARLAAEKDDLLHRADHAPDPTA